MHLHYAWDISPIVIVLVVLSSQEGNLTLLRHQSCVMKCAHNTLLHYVSKNTVHLRQSLTPCGTDTDTMQGSNQLHGPREKQCSHYLQIKPRYLHRLTLADGMSKELYVWLCAVYSYAS